MTVVRELEVDIALPEGAKRIIGKAKTMLGQLAGRDHKSRVGSRSCDYGRSPPRGHDSEDGEALREVKK